MFRDLVDDEWSEPKFFAFSKLGQESSLRRQTALT
jgi:hypothetical protein